MSPGCSAVLKCPCTNRSAAAPCATERGGGGRVAPLYLYTQVGRGVYWLVIIGGSIALRHSEEVGRSGVRPGEAE